MIPVMVRETSLSIYFGHNFLLLKKYFCLVTWSFTLLVYNILGYVFCLHIYRNFGIIDSYLKLKVLVLRIETVAFPRGGEE